MKQKTILITGAAKHLGAHLAKTLGKQSAYRLVLHYHKSADAIKKVAKQSNAVGYYQADLTQLDQVKTMFSKIGRVDILINTVGNFIYKPLKETGAEELKAIMENNLLSAWYCIKEALPGMRKRRFGRIINFGSVGCDQITVRPLTTPYYMAKSSLLMLSKSLAREETKNGISINMISPGVLAHGVLNNTKDVPTIPFESVGRTVLFLLDEKNAHLSGAHIEVSAGWRPE
ncbi:MAG: SDR family NAD(P)-dependent oxidoreductase [Candidatus Magasanikbacteria bacterium]|nr:SDR family NAD(P)-dependent oxidoreductase [Candidatus Magasanikbacteria bacterium]